MASTIRPADRYRPHSVCLFRPCFPTHPKPICVGIGENGVLRQYEGFPFSFPALSGPMPAKTCGEDFPSLLNPDAIRWANLWLVPPHLELDERISQSHCEEQHPDADSKREESFNAADSPTRLCPVTRPCDLAFDIRKFQPLHLPSQGIREHQAWFQQLNLDASIGLRTATGGSVEFPWLIGFRDSVPFSVNRLRLVSEATPNENPVAANQHLIRRAHFDDLDPIQDLLQPFIEQRKLLRRMRSELILLMANGYVAEIFENGKSKIVGFAAVEIYSRKLGEIQCLAVDDGYQGRGIGSDLVRACVDRARDKGILEVMAISASDAFLRKLGFDYSLPEQKRALFFQLHSRDDIFRDTLENEEE